MIIICLNYNILQSWCSYWCDQQKSSKISVSGSGWFNVSGRQKLNTPDTHAKQPKTAQDSHVRLARCDDTSTMELSSSGSDSFGDSITRESSYDEDCDDDKDVSSFSSSSSSSCLNSWTINKNTCATWDICTDGWYRLALVIIVNDDGVIGRKPSLTGCWLPQRYNGSDNLRLTS